MSAVFYQRDSGSPGAEPLSLSGILFMLSAYRKTAFNLSSLRISKSHHLIRPQPRKRNYHTQVSIRLPNSLLLGLIDISLKNFYHLKMRECISVHVGQAGVQMGNYILNICCNFCIQFFIKPLIQTSYYFILIVVIIFDSSNFQEIPVGSCIVSNTEYNLMA